MNGTPEDSLYDLLEFYSYQLPIIVISLNIIPLAYNLDSYFYYALLAVPALACIVIMSELLRRRIKRDMGS